MVTWVEKWIAGNIIRGDIVEQIDKTRNLMDSWSKGTVKYCGTLVHSWM